MSWQVKGKNPSHIYSNDLREVIAEVYDGDKAELIAAAPDMAEALKTLCMYFDKTHPEHEAFVESCVDYPADTEQSYAQMQQEFWDKARAALAKADVQ